jgi:tetratricopeptide (TPR) repeat protein
MYSGPKSALSFLMAAALLNFGAVSLPEAALAAMSAQEGQRLDQYEIAIFGKARANLADESRLRALEVNLFGKVKSGSTVNRLDAIGKAVGKDKGLLMPPLAGHLDPAGLPNAQANGGSSGGDPQMAPQAAQPQDDTDVAPDRTKDILRQAIAAHNQGNLTRAEGLFKQVLAADPRNSDANFNLGAMYEDRGDLEGALKYYRLAAQASPDDRDIADAVSSVSDKLRQQQQAKISQKQLQDKLELKQIADDAAAAYRAGKYDIAINDLNQIASQVPDDPNVQYGLGQAWRGKGDLNRARQYLNRAVALAPDNQLYRTSLADLNASSARHTASNSADHGFGDDGQGQGLQSYGNSGSLANNDSGAPAGDIQPFTSQGDATLQGHAYDSHGYHGGGLMSLGFGGLGGGLSSGLAGGTRLKRAAIGGLAGAAIGALTGSFSHTPGAVRSGAMRGGITGGLFGLLTGF